MFNHANKPDGRLKAEEIRYAAKVTARRAVGMVAARTRRPASRSRSDLFADEEKRKGRREDDGRRGHKQPTEEQWR